MFVQNIIKKVIGQKFVYKFVSFPDILKMDPALVESGRSSEESAAMMSEPDAEDDDVAVRSGYLHSGLYSSFTVSSLQRPSEPQTPTRVEPRSDHLHDTSTVIRFITNRGHTSLPSSPPPTSADSSHSPRLTIRQPLSPPTLHRSPTYTEERRRRSQSTETEESEQNVQPLNLSSGQRERSQSTHGATVSPEGRGLADGVPVKSRKPRDLDITAPSLLLTGSDLVSIALNSPALPSGSLTPAFFTAQVQYPVLQYHCSISTGMT